MFPLHLQGGTMKLRFLCAMFVLLAVVACKNDSGTSTPQIRISTVTPNQIAAGEKDVQIELAGNGFNSVSSVTIVPDVSVKTFQSLDAAHIRVTVDVPLTASPGPRTVTVSTATGSANLDTGLQIVANKKPKASFSVEPSSGSQGTLFTFDGRASNDTEGKIKKYHWDFGNGSTSTDAVAKHSFPQTGKHVVTLTIKDEAGLEDSARDSVQVIFDPAAAVKQIEAVCREFLNLFAQLETLTAEEIVVGFVSGQGCQGRKHEIDIINRHKGEGGFVNVDILGATEVQNLTEFSATSNLGARFYGRHEDGTTFDGIVTHYFEMRNGSEGWKICNFRAQ
jgi:hypothetical protein